MEHLGFHWADFHELWYWSIFRKYVEKTEVSLKPDKNNGQICDNISMNSFCNEKMFRHSCREKKTRVLCSVTFLRKCCRFWGKVEGDGRVRQTTDGNIIRRARFACWITKATDTHSAATIVTRTRFNVTFIRPLPVLLTT